MPRIKEKSPPLKSSLEETPHISPVEKTSEPVLQPLEKSPYLILETVEKSPQLPKNLRWNK